MNIWHLQLHQNKRLSTPEILKIVTEKKVIGLAKSWKNKNGIPVNDPVLFKKKMTINDLVLIRNTITPVALVKVKSDAFLEAFPDENLDWFPLRREVDVLDVFSEKEEELLKSILKKHNKRQIQALGTLTLCKTKTATREFIEKWFENL